MVLNIGHVLQEADRTDEAIAAYEQAIRLKPDYVMAHSNLGGALCDAGRPDEAIRPCREAIRLNPGYHEAHVTLGRALLQTGDLDAAIAALREALRLTRLPSGGRHLAKACLRKVVAGLRFVHRWIDRNIVRLRSPRPFLQTLLDPRSVPMLRRHFVLNLLASAVLAAQAQAQTGPGTIYYRYGSTSPQQVYRVSGDGTGNVQLGPFPVNMVRSTSLNTYPGGRQFLSSSQPLGPIPGISGNYGDIVLYSEQGAAPTTVTNFRGPQYIDQNGTGRGSRTTSGTASSRSWPTTPGPPSGSTTATTAPSRTSSSPVSCLWCRTTPGWCP